MSHSPLLWIAVLLLITISSQAEERLDLEGTSVIGSNELPQVLYIVPWKKMGMSRLKVPPEMSLVQNALQSIDRDEFHRKINLYRALQKTK